MEEYIAILMLVAPGFIVRKVNEMFISKNKVDSDLEKTIIALLYGVPIIAINIVVLSMYYKFKTIESILSYMGDIVFLGKYFIATIISMIIVAAVSIILNKYTVTKYINILRKLLKLAPISSNQTPWEDFFSVLSDKEYLMPVEIIKNGESIGKGFVKHWDLDGQSDKDLILEFCDELEEAKEFTKEVKKIYYDTKNDILIKEYIFDEEGFTKWKEDSKSQ